MAESPRLPDTDQADGVTIGDVFGGIWNSIIAGGDVIVQNFTGSNERRAQRNRRAMLELVKNTWIKGVLEQSMHGAAMIELGMEERADAVERPWDMVVRMPDREDRELPPGTRIIDVFDEANGSLLILGEPGSGKTTILLDLARSSIARAEEDPLQPIPVVFNLSSWAESRQSIADWLVEELNRKYQIPKRIARTWVANDDLLLLLDGLDEVPEGHQDMCVGMLNEFLQEHMVLIAVSSRITRYSVLEERLHLSRAVLLQPIGREQIEHYLRETGAGPLAALRTLQHDPTLRELARTPLMLSIIALSYQGMSVDSLRSLGSIEARRRHVLHAYVQEMLKRGGVEGRHPPRKTARWLANLATSMCRHSQNMFLMEEISPDWLCHRSQRRRYRFLAGAAAVLLNWLILLLGLDLGRELIVRLDCQPPLRPDFGALLGLNYDPLAEIWNYVPITVWDYGVIVGMVAGLFVGKRAGPDFVSTTETVAWSWRQAGMGLISGLMAGLVLGLGWGFIVGLVLGLATLPKLGVKGGLTRGVKTWILSGLLTWLATGFAFGSARGLISVDLEKTVRPNQGTRQALRTAIAFGVISGMLASLALGLTIGSEWGLISGLIVGLWLGFSSGGIAVIQHLVLRFILFRDNHLPWDLLCLLNHARDCILMRKVGGGYIFIHQLLQEYFASLYEEEYT